MIPYVRKALFLIFICLSLSSCATLGDMQDSEGIDKTVGAFRLNPVAPNSYWYDGKAYEYNDYEIDVDSVPVIAKIYWNGKAIGTTPMKYRYTGTLDRDEVIHVRAVPMDENLPAQESALRVRTELPRKIRFDLKK